MKRIIFYISLAFTLFFASQGMAQTAGGTANQNEYDADHIKERSKKSHKKADKITKQNTKAQEHASKQAEKNRKDKLSGRKKDDDNHQFPH